MEAMVIEMEVNDLKVEKNVKIPVPIRESPSEITSSTSWLKTL